MTNDGIIYCFGLMKLNYPNLFQYDNEELKAFRNLWLIQFNEYDDKDVSNSLQVCIGRCKYPPTIAEIKDILNDTCDVYEEDFHSKEELWELVLKAGGNANYHAQEEYDNLPNNIKSIVSISMLKDIANSDRESLKFIKRDFLSDYAELKNKLNKNREISSIENGRIGIEHNNYISHESNDIEVDSAEFDEEIAKNDCSYFKEKWLYK